MNFWIEGAKSTNLVVLLPKDIIWRIGALDQARQIEAGGIIHKQLFLSQNFSPGFCKKKDGGVIAYHTFCYIALMTTAVVHFK